MFFIDFEEILYKKVLLVCISLCIAFILLGCTEETSEQQMLSKIENIANQNQLEITTWIKQELNLNNETVPIHTDFYQTFQQKDLYYIYTTNIKAEQFNWLPSQYMITTYNGVRELTTLYATLHDPNKQFATTTDNFDEPPGTKEIMDYVSIFKNADITIIDDQYHAYYVSLFHIIIFSNKTMIIIYQHRFN